MNPGDTVSHYRVVDEIGRGGMGIVYRAVDTKLAREVALKVLPPELVADASRRRRFVQEARAAAALDHPNIGVIYEIDDADGVSFIAMELIRGDPLSSLLSHGALPLRRALEIATEIAGGLARAHDTGVVHRDLKPANVMVTRDGHAKIIDFGVAKLVEPAVGDELVTRVTAATNPGVALGTVGYMSPEQARGQRVDCRTDIFSFGVILHELISGTVPFHAASDLDTLHAILHDPAPRLFHTGGTLIGDAISEVQRIVDKCLEKDPRLRYQSMRDVAVDLRHAQRLLESAALEGIAEPIRRSSYAWRWTWFVGTVLGVAVLGSALWRTRRVTTASFSGKPSVAVLYFENNTGSAALDWLRTGLTDMIVTDLSQSPDVEVLPMDRLHQILRDLNRQDDRVISFDTVQEVARRAGVKTVLLGSYVKAGDAIRINLTLQEAANGQVVSAERADASGESTLFSTVDELTRQLRTALTPPRAPERLLPNAPGAPVAGGMVADLKDVTTSSVAAYRLYLDGIDLHEHYRWEEAARRFDQAIAVDPNFAMAYAKAAVDYANLSRPDKRDEYAAHALAHSEHLSARERYYIEGFAKSWHIDELNDAIAAYSKALELYPDDGSSRVNLAGVFLDVGRYTDARREYSEAIRRGLDYYPPYVGLVFAELALGHPDTALNAFDDHLARHPDDALSIAGRGLVLNVAGRDRDAVAAFGRARALAPGNSDIEVMAWQAAVAADRWSDADVAVGSLRASIEPVDRWRGAVYQAYTELYRGHTDRARDLFAQAAINSPPELSELAAEARQAEAEIDLATNRPMPAIALAATSVTQSLNRPPEFVGRFLLALAQARAGEAAESASAIDTLSNRARGFPSDREQRRLHFLRGLIASDRGDVKAALVELQSASADSPRCVVNQPDAILDQTEPIAFALGAAEIAQGDDVDGARLLRSVTSAGPCRAEYPIEFVRSLYLLAQTAERHGDMADARELYSRYVAYWSGGDIDREHVADARRKLGLH